MTEESFPGVPAPEERELNDLTDEQVAGKNVAFIDQLVLDIAYMLKTCCQTGALKNQLVIPLTAEGDPYTIAITVRKG